MGWARLSTDLDNYPAVSGLLDDEHGFPALGLWVLCLAWAQRNRRRVPRGFIPAEIPAQLGCADAELLTGKLVGAGLWKPHDDGWVMLGEHELFRFGPLQLSRKHIPLELRRRVYERDGWKCMRCGTGNHLSLDHIIPYSLGGNDEESNLQTLCRSCNSRKGTGV
jgi:hypothetical protein